MSITVTTPPDSTRKKRIRRSGLRGSTCLVQRRSGKVEVVASADHQSICKSVLGPDDKPKSLDSYIAWGDVPASKIVDVIYQVELGRSK